MSYYRDPKLEFKKVTFENEKYLYIEEENPNVVEKEDQLSWVYIELKNFWMKKQGRVLTLGNHIGTIYTLTGYSESMTNQWAKSIKNTIGFP